MKKVHLIGLALMAVFAFLAVSATSAFAAIEWLVEGRALTAAVKAETEGELELVPLSETGTALNRILCSGIFIGTIGPGGADKVTGLQDLAHKTIGTDLASLTGEGLTCEVTAHAGSLADCNNEVGHNTALVWIANVPWTTSLELMEPSGEWLDLFGPGTGGEPGYEVECTLLSGLILTDLCTGHTSALILTVGEGTPLGVHGEFNFEAPISSEEATCSVNASGAGTQGLGITWAVGAQLEHLETTVSHP